MRSASHKPAQKQAPKQAPKQAMQRAPVQQAGRRERDAQGLRRAARRERIAASHPKPGDIVVDHDFHPAPENIQAEEIEIDPQIDESESAEP